MTGAIRAVSLETLPAYARERLSAAGRVPEERLQRHCFALPKLDLEAWFSGPDLADLCNRRFVQREPGEAAASAAAIRVLDATLAGWEHPATWDVERGFMSRDFDRVLGRFGLRGFYHHDTPSWQFYDPAARLGVYTLPRPMDIPPWETGSPLRLFLHWAHAAADLRLTHAATLGVGGSGALIVGAGGSGKSGTTVAGLMNGLQSAGDDYVLVEAGGEIAAHAVFRVFKLDADGLQRAGLDPAGIAGATLNWRGKHEFDAVSLKPAAFVRRLPIRAILLPEIARLSRTRIEPASAREAALALAPSAVFQLPGDADDGFRFFAALARRLPAFRLRLSEDPAEIADAIGTHLSREFPVPVSVIMPAFNAARFIGAAIASLLRERDALDLDIVVVDDGSTDETRAIVDRLARDFPEIRLLQNPRKGIAAARNTGLDNRRADSRHVTFLDSDDMSFPGRLARQCTILDENPDVDVLYGRVQMFSEFDPDSLAPRKGSRTKIIRGPYLQSAMYRPEVFATVGRFDESFRQGCDTDYVLRVVERGQRLLLDDGIAAFYRRHDANVTLDTAEMKREFMLASLKWAARNRLKKGGDLPAVFRELFMPRDEIEKDF